MKTKTKKGSFLIGILLLSGVFCTDVLWNAPSPILNDIMADLSINLTQGGIIMSVIMLIYSASTFCFEIINRRVAARYLFLAGMIFMAAGECLFLFVAGFSNMIILRLMIGIGMGLVAPAYAVLVMENIPEKKRPLINALYAGMPYAALIFTAFSVAAVYQGTSGSWRMTLSVFGIPACVIVFFIAVFIKSFRRTEQDPGVQRGGRILAAARMKEVRLLLTADMCDMWGYTFLAGFLPTFLQQEAGMSLGKASAMMALFSAAGMIGCAAGGVLMIWSGLRKPFTWPMHLMIFAGTLMMALCDGPMRIAGIVLAGFGNAAWAPALYTMPMEFEGVDAGKAGAVFSFIFGVGYIAGFLSSLAGGWIGDHFTLRAAFVVNSFAALIAAAATFLMKETGKKSFDLS